MSDLRHIRIEAKDGILLPALWYTSQGSAQLAIYVHGAGSSSIIRSPQITDTFGKLCNEYGLDFLAFNNRGAGYMTKFDTLHGQSYLGGMSYEVIADFTYDIIGVIDWAYEKGYSSVVLIGHSTGANKVVYELSLGSHYALPITGAVLMSGGDDVALQRSRYGESKLETFIKHILQQVNEGHARQLAPPDIFPGDHPISWQSLYELICQDSNYDIFPFKRTCDKLVSREQAFRRLKAVKQPTLLVYGSDDFGTVVPVDAAVNCLKRLVPQADAIVLEGADHNFSGFESELAEQIVRWIKSQTL